jgi:hypothetical protein
MRHVGAKHFTKSPTSYILLPLAYSCEHTSAGFGSEPRGSDIEVLDFWAIKEFTLLSKEANRETDVQLSELSYASFSRTCSAAEISPTSS